MLLISSTIVCIITSCHQLCSLLHVAKIRVAILDQRAGSLKIQASLLIDKDDKIAVKTASNTQARAISCIFEKIPNEQSRINGSIVEEIIGMTTNTKQRLLEFIALNKALDGTVTSVPSGEVCDE